MRFFLLALALTSPVCHSAPVDVPVFSQWKDPVAVYLDPHAPVTEDQAGEAVKVWQGLGHPVSLRLTSPEGGLPPTFPAIVVHLGTEDPELAADTKTTHQGNPSRILYAHVYIKPFLGDDTVLVLTHEIGHALGYNHVNVPGHVMHHHLDYAGWNTEGLER